MSPTPIIWPQPTLITDIDGHFLSIRDGKPWIETGAGVLACEATPGMVARLQVRDAKQNSKEFNPERICQQEGMRVFLRFTPAQLERIDLGIEGDSHA